VPLLRLLFRLLLRRGLRRRLDELMDQRVLYNSWEGLLYYYDPLHKHSQFVVQLVLRLVLLIPPQLLVSVQRNFPTFQKTMALLLLQKQQLPLYI
jgi:hypothetical protein